MDRREALKTFSAGAAALALVRPRASLAAPAAAGSSEGLVQPRTTLPGGWMVDDVTKPDKGGFSIILTREGEAARLSVCARSDRTPGIARTRRTDIYVVNHGRGVIPTDPSVIMSARDLSDRLADAEDGAMASLVDQLQTLERRTELYGPEVLL